MNTIKICLLCSVVCLFVGNVRTADDDESADVNTGHLQPLCSDAPVQGITIMHEMPTPEYFYEWFVKPAQPVLFKSVLDNMDYPAYTLWTDEYLKKKYGQTEVDVEQTKKETREAALVETIEKFLDTYNNSDIYMAHDMREDMFDDIALPRCLRCGGFSQRLYSHFMWFSSGGTKSVLHRDGFDNINCILDGSKDFIFIDKKHRDRIEADGFVHDGSYSKVDVDKVDMKKFPKLKKIPWIKAHIEKGDCLFVPQYWYHQVNSFGKRNLAVNLWWAHIPWFNYTDCEIHPADSLPPHLSSYHTLTVEENSRLNFLNLFEDLTQVTKAEFLKFAWLQDGVCVITDVGDEHCTSPKVEQLFDFLDADSDGVLSWEELLTFNVYELQYQFSDVIHEEEVETEVAEIGKRETENAKAEETDRDEF